MNKPRFLAVAGCAVAILFLGLSQGFARTESKPQGKRNINAARQRVEKHKELSQLRMEAAKRAKAARALAAAKKRALNKAVVETEGGKK